MIKELIFNQARWLNIDAISYPQDCVVKRGSYCFEEDDSYTEILKADRKGQLLAVDHNLQLSGFASSYVTNPVAFVRIEIPTGMVIVYTSLANVTISGGGKAPL